MNDEPYWRLDAIDEDTLDRIRAALVPFVTEDSLTAAVHEVLRAERDGPRVEDFVPDFAVYCRRKAVTEAIGFQLASSLPRAVYEQVDMGWLEHALAVAAEKVYEPVIAGRASRESGSPS